MNIERDISYVQDVAYAGRVDTEIEAEARKALRRLRTYLTRLEKLLDENAAAPFVGGATQ